MLVAFSIAMITFDWSELGSQPSGASLKRIQDSTNYSVEKGRFVNRVNYASAKSSQENKLSWKMIKDWVEPGINRVPAGLLPEVAPDFVAFVEPSADLKVIWFGHSSFLLNIAGKIILVDPMFSESASPVKMFVKRFQKPVVMLEALPDIDYIVISHDHYDHLDKETIGFFTNREVTFITPLGVGSHLKQWGIKENNIIENDWWQTVDFGPLRFTATPANHFSGRSGADANATLWASWVIKSDSHSVFFSGDSGYGSHFKDVGERLGPFDVAFIESGQYNENWKDVHMFPREGVQAFKDLRAQRYFPVHWGMFELSLHPWNDSVRKLYEYSVLENFTLLTPKIGETVNIDKPFKNERWWDSLALANTGGDSLVRR